MAPPIGNILICPNSEVSVPSLDEMDVGDVWFQQDGATAHMARTAVRVLWERFPGRRISFRSDLQWPARPPDIAPCGYFLWGCLKSFGYTDPPRTQKENIRQAIANIPISKKNGVFWVVTPCGSCKNRRFGGTWRLLHQGDKNR
jgi:hypothetical protein